MATIATDYNSNERKTEMRKDGREDGVKMGPVFENGDEFICGICCIELHLFLGALRNKKSVESLNMPTFLFLTHPYVPDMIHCDL